MFSASAGGLKAWNESDECRSVMKQHRRACDAQAHRIVTIASAQSIKCVVGRRGEGRVRRPHPAAGRGDSGSRGAGRRCVATEKTVAPKRQSIAFQSGLKLLSNP
ncbi:hypothetical protein [Burkholderia ubonensis]|uniref:hypothetical protein n=1 Tax=Burkholderia ubonensis TaxID=101571 RepID=UPI0015A654B5|nr:hypothetical protein [Burkholderia ubonensis]